MKLKSSCLAKVFKVGNDVILPPLSIAASLCLELNGFIRIG
jgi:hypothetical protein